MADTNMQGAPDSVVRGIARQAATVLGFWLVKKGYDMAGSEEFTSLAAQVIGGVLAMALGVGLSIAQKYRVTDFIRTANQLEAFHPSTPAAAVVAAVGERVAINKEIAKT